MTHLVPIRGGELPHRLVLVREGVNTLTDAALEQACQRSHELMGIRGFSVLELPRGGFEALARLRPLLRVRRNVRTAIPSWQPASCSCPRGTIRIGR